ncbi:AsnC family transcriptional regulator [Candidatus Methylobacter oryzae]|uniref:siroheme decarboxylase n=1 Tax=Candidatus Methylobacter oryzae TaxID=2497749 RepID=A0ABY3CG03_9GAMM|nr:AsnC family transcriptional regulator [Candidatus Methylobacter oryzae]TRX02679.1 Lrp/AsnC family transcriptional regulator [Candidatus Methylobacter oryzae]
MLDEQDRQLLSHIQLGLPICARPYAEIGRRCGMNEAEVIARLTRLKQQGLIKRMGVIVKHRQLGYRANAMIVWNVPDHLVKQLGGHISRFPFVTLCYQRPRQPEWPYNLYCMIHGKDRDTVLSQLNQLTEACGLNGFDREILFSRRCFKQRGAIYQSPAPALTDG